MSSQNRYSKFGGTLLFTLLCWLSKQPAIWSHLFYSMIELTWPVVALESVHAFIRGAMAFIIFMAAWYLLVSRLSSILAILHFLVCKSLDLAWGWIISLQISSSHFFIFRLSKFSGLEWWSNSKVNFFSLR